MTLEERIAANKARVRIDNSREYAGSPMHFDCTRCGGDIVVPEDYLTRPTLCQECRNELATL